MMVIFQSTGTMGNETSERQGKMGRSLLMCSPTKLLLEDVKSVLARG